jgi:PST family polysaccharide transporter
MPPIARRFFIRNDPSAAARADIFTFDERRGSLRGRAIRGGAVTGLGQAAKFILRVGSTAVLARLLTPEDYGLVAMTAVVTGFAGMFKDAGLASATVQRAEITHQQISTLFWINVAAGFVIALLLALVSPAVAAFYREPRLIGIMCATAPSFIFGGLTVQHQALLRRQMRFKALAALEIFSMVPGVLLAIILAFLGYGYWSLVGMTLGTSAFNALGAWVALPWLPGWPSRRCGVMPLVRFGGDVLGFNMANYWARQGDNLLLGWCWGPVVLGFYQRAYNLLLMPINQINAPLSAVAVPALSRAQSDPARFNRFFLNALQLAVSSTLPLVLGIAIFADEVVLLWLGRDWMECAQLFRILSIAAAVGAVTNPVGWLLVSLGHTRKYRIMGLVNSTVVVISFVIGLPYGATGVAFSYSMAMLLLTPPTWVYVLHGTSINLAAVGRAMAPPFLACLPAAAAGWALLNLQIPGLSHAAIGSAAALSFGALYALVLLKGLGKWEFFRGILKELRSGKSGPPAQAQAQAG